MLPCRVCLQQASLRIQQRPARYVRMVLVTLVLLYVLHQSGNYQGNDDNDSDVPHVDDMPSHPHKLRLRVRARSLKPKAPNLESLQTDSLPMPVTLEQKESMGKAIRIALMTSHYFGSDYARDIHNCSLHGVPLTCTYFPSSSEPHLVDLDAAAIEAEAVWWHAPNTCLLPGGPWPRNGSETFSVFKARAEQWSVITSMESSAYYACLDDESFMANFDVRMTYHRMAEVPLLYWSNRYREMWESQPPVPFSKKKDAVAFVNSNCEAPSGRTQIVAALMKQPKLRVDALGRCLSSGGSILSGPEAKHDAFRQYRYCIAIENSIAKDYVTEKIYDALAAGCVPIYLGAENIREFIPSMDAIIDYNAFGSPQALAVELRRLSSNETAYAEKFAWQKQPETWGKEFKAILARAETGAHTQCQLCQVIARDRAGIPDPTSGKLLRQLSKSNNAESPWTQLPRYHVKNLSIQYQLAGEMNIKAKGDA